MSKELKEKSIQDLNKELKDKREALRKFRFSLTGSKTRDLKEGKTLRKEIARILTEINSRHE